jgi:nitrogen fixation-related uncharacterized protein
MKKIVQGAIIVGAFFVLAGCASGQVDDKRAPGMPGKKTYQILVDNDQPYGPDKYWITVTEDVWTKCRLGDRYEDCQG